MMNGHPKLGLVCDAWRSDGQGILSWAGLCAFIFCLCALAFARGETPVPVFACDFDSDTWFTEWGLKQKPERCDTVADDPARQFEPLQGRALRIRVDKDGHYGASLDFQFKKRTGAEPEEIYFRYYLRFADDWKPERGGKLPGFGGTYDRAGWGGRRVNGRDGWSARGLFLGQRDGRTPIGYYCYHADMKSQYGDNWVWNTNQLGFLENNCWYGVEQYVRLNTPGKNDGVLRGWVNGDLAFEKTDVRMRDVDTLKIETLWLNVYYGGTWTAKADYHLYIDDVVISRQPIGLLKPRPMGEDKSGRQRQPGVPPSSKRGESADSH
jgi:Polysaccharide lyase 14